MLEVFMNMWRDLLTDNAEQADISIASVSYDKAASVGKGAKQAPAKIRNLSSYLPPATKDGESLMGLKLYDFGDIGDDDTDYDVIEKRAAGIINADRFSLFLGGDHSVTIPIQKAFFSYWQKQNKIPAIIHIDAHPDFCNFYDGSSYSHACTNYRAVDNGYLWENIVLLGIRGYEIQEIELFRNHPEIKIFRASDILENGIGIVRSLKEKFDSRYAVYLSFDIDAIDPAYCPGTGTPEAFGISSSEINAMIQFFSAELPVKAMDIVEVSPQLDVNDVTSWTALKIIYELFGTLLRKKLQK